MDIFTSTKQSNETDASSWGIESSFEFVLAFREMFIEAFSATSDVHHKASFEDSFSGQECNRCQSETSDEGSPAENVKTLAIAADFNALRDSEGRRVVITPSRNKTGERRPQRIASIVHCGADGEA